MLLCLCIQATTCCWNSDLEAEWQNWAGPTEVHEAAVAALSQQLRVTNCRLRPGGLTDDGRVSAERESRCQLLRPQRRGQKGGGRKAAVCREPQQKNKAALRGEGPGHSRAAGRAPLRSHGSCRVELHTAAANKYAHKASFLIFNLLEGRNNLVLGLEPQ